MNKNNVALFILVGLVVLGCIVLGGGYAYVNGVRSQGLALEKPISAQYQACQLVYSAYTAGFTEQFGVYMATLKGLDVFMSDAVKGRYDMKDTSGKTTGTIDANLFINAIAEAYPSTQGITDIANKLLDYVQGQRESFKNCQSKLVDMLNNYDLWRVNGIVQSQIIRMLGFPSENLVARLGDQKWTGSVAEDKMYQLVMTSTALNAYKTGVDTPLLTPAP